MTEGHLVTETAATAFDEGVATSSTLETSSATTAPPGTALALAGLLLSGALVRAGARSLADVYTGRTYVVQAGGASTAPTPVSQELLDRVELLFQHGAGQFFTDGMHSPFSRQLLELIEGHGTEALRAIGELFANGIGNEDAASEALRWLADFGDASTSSHRLNILRMALRHRSPHVRDGAILGLAALDDRRGIPLLESARSRELVSELVRLIDQALHQLRR